MKTIQVSNKRKINNLNISTVPASGGARKKKEINLIISFLKNYKLKESKPFIILA